MPTRVPPAPLTRRDWLRHAGAAALALVAGRRLAADSPDSVGDAPPPPMVVYKDPNCGCCTAWNEHMTAAGFRLQVKDTAQMAQVKGAIGVPAALQSCHTGVIAGYFVEGHVPADLVQKLVREKPAIAGLAVPGMPAGSPGMEGPPPERYDILAVSRTGTVSVYATRMGRPAR
jgi:hypothetical protein